MAQVFISFIHEEIQWAECVQRFIRNVLPSGVEPFLASDKLLVYAGERWLDRIMEELTGAKVLILMLSPESVKRPWVNFEAGVAAGKAIVTIPVCIRGLDKGKLPVPYSSLQAVNLVTYASDEHDYLARSVAHYLSLPEPSVRCYGVNIATIAELLGGPDARRRAEKEDAAYTQLDEELERLEKQ